MKKIFLLSAFLLTIMSTASVAQYREDRYALRDDPAPRSFKIGTQIPFQHSIIYDHGITPGFSINAGLGLITKPYTNVQFSSLENAGLITSNERGVIDRTFQLGVSYQLGANFHFNKNYVRAYGQLMTLNGDMSYSDLANLYLGTNIPDFTRFLNPIDIRSTVPMVGVLYGRRFTIGDRSEIHLEGSIGKTLGHHTSYKTSTFLDGMNLINDVVYSGIDNDLDSYFTKNGWIPSLNVYYVFRF
ncbi:MAG TPA: hypothetical protein VFT90_09230 [Chryseosolibacter sp.]|nr:hypothetical protein [Chryseosolibacter sp.]